MNFFEDGRTNRLKSGIIPLVILTLLLSVSVSVVIPCTYAAGQGRVSEDPYWVGVGYRPHGGSGEEYYDSTTAGVAVYECMCGSENEDCDWDFDIYVDGIRKVSEGDYNCICLEHVDGTFDVQSVGQEIRMEIEINCYEDCGIWGEVYMPPKADFQANPISGLAPLVVQFQNLSLGYCSGYTWHFGDGTWGNGENPTHSYDSPGEYTVSLTARGRVPGLQTSIETKQIHVFEGFIGDVNNDGMITASDAQLCFHILLGFYPPTPGEEYRADANEDGQITSNDAQIIFQQSLR